MNKELDQLKKKKTIYLVLSIISIVLSIAALLLVFVNSSSLIILISIVLRFVFLALFIVFLCLNIKTGKKLKALNNTQITPIQMNSISSTDELRKYKALLDDGIITQEEFETKKKELLNS